MRRGGGLVLRVLGYGWLLIWAATVIGTCTMNGLQAGDVLGFIGRTQDFFSPFNLVNWIVMVLAASPGLAAVFLSDKLSGRSAS